MEAALPPRGVIFLRPARATQAIIVGNLVYFAMVWIAGRPIDPIAALLGSDLSVLVNFGANSGRLVADGEIWRLIASMFLHSGVLHLGLNLLSLFFLGRNVEAFYGPWAFLFVFLVSGLGGSIASATLSNAISVGASGAVFGLAGVSIVFAFRFRGALPPRVTKIMGTFLLPLVGANIVLGLTFPFIDSKAHLGGLLVGAVLALFIRPEALAESEGRRSRETSRIFAATCLPLLFVSFAGSAQNIFRTRGLDDARIAWILQDERIRAVTDALERNPTDTELLGLRAQLHMLSGDWLESIQDYQAVLAITPDDAMVMNNLAWLLLEEAPQELRNRREATRLASRAVELEPTDPYVLGTYGTARLRDGDAPEAARFLAEALAQKRAGRDEATDRYLLAIALARLGRFQDAISSLEQAVRQDPSSRYRSEADAELGDWIQSDSAL
jgi:rhomboid protease GluP